MKWILLVLTVGLIVLHQDFWNWRESAPLVAGFLPVGLWYHALFCVAASILLALFVATSWPKHLENAQPETDERARPKGKAVTEVLRSFSPIGFARERSSR